MPSEKGGTSPKKEKDLRRSLRYQEIWNVFMCQFRSLGVVANEAYPLCKHARIDGDHLLQLTRLVEYLADDFVSRYWEARRQMVKKPSTNVGRKRLIVTSNRMVHKVYRNNPHSLEELQQDISDEISVIPAIQLQPAFRNLLTRAQKYPRDESGQF
ncbi:hypothetical protein TNCV_2320261 [Trichonephila clavipes]|nr:hypothetical protein TNCV_2320261 [Trichonephila clavipes]